MIKHDIEIFNNANIIELDDNVIEIFKRLSKNFSKNKQIHRPQKYLKKTTIVTDILCNIKTIINKITLESYEENSNKLIEEYNLIDDKTKYANSIFDILSKNIFFSSLYGRLYSKLITTSSVFSDVLTENKELLDNIYSNINVYDSNKEYDLFCKHNKINDEIKARTSFYGYLLLNDELDVNFITDKILFLIELIKNSESDLKSFEYIENINIYITKTYDTIVQTKVYDEIISMINNMKNKKEGFQHLKNKSIFKCMDILDYIETKN